MFEAILHPSDFTETSQIAFSHALRIALAARAELQLLHVATASERCNYSDFPKVRDTLEAWQVIPKGSKREAVRRLGVDIHKLVIEGHHPVSAISSFLETNPSSLIVMAAHTSSHRWLSYSRSEAVARASNASALFVPDDSRGFVSPETGKVQLNAILLPAAVEPSPTIALRTIKSLTRLLRLEPITIHVLHVGTKATLPAIPRSDGLLHYEVHIQGGNLVDSIVSMADQLRVDLVTMATDGHDGFMDALRGSTTEKVLRRVSCPLLAIPPMG